MALVVGYDRHPVSRAALLFAAELAGALNVPLHVVHVADLSDKPIAAEPQTLGGVSERQLQVEERSVRSTLEATGVQWSYHLMDGDPVTSLIDAASQHAASMIVVGRPEQGIGAAFGHLVSGAVARTLIRRSDRPVVVVPAGAHSLPRTPGSSRTALSRVDARTDGSRIDRDQSHRT